MEYIQLISEKLFSFISWGWGNGGWWFVGGGLSCLVFLGLGIHRAPYR